jgi:hypothetical protein
MTACKKTKRLLRLSMLCGGETPRRSGTLAKRKQAKERADCAIASQGLKRLSNKGCGHDE